MWLRLAFSVLVAIVVTAEALQCYKCNSVENNACGDPISSTDAHPITCGSAQRDENTTFDELGLTLEQNITGRAGTPPLCLKFIATKGSEKDTRRHCSNLGTETCEQVRIAVEKDGKQLEFCGTCDQDLCNHVPSLLYTGVSHLLVVLGAMFLARYATI